MTANNPPEGCPMHNNNSATSTPPPPQSNVVEGPDGPYCPMPHKKESSVKQPSQSSKPTIPPGCPMHNNEEALNKLNMMPSNLSQNPQQDQKINLPTDRVISSIPKSKDGGEERWEYPSPQQFYNALKRKGWETPEEEIETMVDIHNFLNEEAWNEVLKWESKFKCDCAEDPYLAKFQGRPKEISPKARWHSFFGAPKPFDRHDWYVKRCEQQRRYVIDYYEAPEEVPGVPVFHLDVRPALDDVPSVMLRFKEAAKMKWDQWFPSAPS